MIDMKFFENNEDPEICADCGGYCCKIMPGCSRPQEFGSTPQEIKENVEKALRSQKYAIDWYERGEDDEVGDDVEMYYLRPATMMHAGRIFDPSFGGICIFFEATGCMLPFDDRPYDCQNLKPEKGKGTCGYEKDDDQNAKYMAALAWKPYWDMLQEVGDKIVDDPDYEEPNMHGITANIEDMLHVLKMMDQKREQTNDP
jgi:hypothetical protein